MYFPAQRLDNKMLRPLEPKNTFAMGTNGLSNSFLLTFFLLSWKSIFMKDWKFSKSVFFAVLYFTLISKILSLLPCMLIYCRTASKDIWITWPLQEALLDFYVFFWQDFFIKKISKKKFLALIWRKLNPTRKTELV